MHIDRLERLIKILENVPKTEFCLTSWRNSCGTTACAFGWAALDEEFNRLGLHFRNTVPWFQDSPDYSAAQKFFGISDSQSHVLFNPTAYRVADWDNPKAVISRIKTMIYEEKIKLEEQAELAAKEKNEKIEVRLETPPIEITRKPKKLVDMSDSY